MVKVEWDLFKSPAGELAAVFIKSFEFEGQDHESHEIRMNLRAKIIATVSTKDGRQIFEAPHGQVFVFHPAAAFAATATTSAGPSTAGGSLRRAGHRARNRLRHGPRRVP